MFLFGGWIALSFLVAFAGKNKKIGFWSTFIISVLLTPLIGLIVALVSDPIRKVGPRKCTHCGFVDKTGSQFCTACGKDRTGKTKEDYQALANDPEYQAKLKQEEEKKAAESKVRQQRPIKILLALIAISIVLMVYLYLDKNVF